MLTPPTPILFAAAPPEVHSTLLNLGPGPEPVATAGVSWFQLSVQYTAGMAELEEILGEVSAGYMGPSAIAFIKAHQPMVAWLEEAALKAGLAAAAHETIAGDYVAAVAAMPTMVELVQNHVTNTILNLTNFFGVNTIPIGLNEADYVRMWGQAASVMHEWDAVSSMAADTIPPTLMPPILLIPGVGEAGNAAATAQGIQAMASGVAAGLSNDVSDVISTKLLVERIAASPASADHLAPGSHVDPRQNGQSLEPEQLMGSTTQQFMSLATQAPQAASSLAQGGPQQILSSAPQMLSSAPQMLGQFLTNAGGAPAGLQPGQAMPVGFAGAGAARAFNPAGLTSFAGGAYGSGTPRALLPSTWNASPATTETSLSSGLAARGPAMATAGASGGTSGGGMLGGGAARNSSRSRRRTTYGDSDPVDEEDEMFEAAEERGSDH